MKSKQWKKIGILIVFLAVAAFALSGCSSGSDGAAGAAGATGATGATGPAGPAGPAAGTDASKMTLAELGAVIDSSTATIDSVTISSPPVVNFTVKDAGGKGISGLGARNTSNPAALLNLRFGIAKLVPGTNGSPSKWVNYIVTTAGTPAATPPGLPVATPPTADREGPLVDKGNGSYTYTFYRDLAKIKDTAGVTDVTYDGTMTHRLVLTVTLGTDPTSGKFPKSKNSILDFTIDPTTKAAIPLTATSTRRDITTTAKCNSCHGDISKMFSGSDNDGGHFDTRPDVRNCISCHNDQMRISGPAGPVPGNTTANSVNYVFAARTETNRRLTPRILDGEAVLDFPILIHKMHMGNRLAKTGYNSDGVLFNEKVYTQDVTNCRTCHSGDTAAELAAAPQGNNWKDKPSRMACGSCHDGIDWATGAGKTVRGALTGHVGGRATSDALCYVCHDAVSIDAIYHVTPNATPNNPNVPAGAANFTYDINSVTVNASNQPVVKFRIMKVVPPATAAAPVTFNVVSGTNPLSGFTGAPSFLVAYAMPQDGIASPADFNNLGNGVLGAQPVSVSIARLCDTSISATGTVGTQGSMTGPDASGYYTATLNGPSTPILASFYGPAPAVSATATVVGNVVATAKAPAGMQALPAMPANPALFPAGTKLRTVALQGYFTQVTPALARHATMVMKSVTGESRRLVVDSAKCANCHEYFEGHGGNRNYNMDGCTVCHNPNLSSSGTIINDPATPEANQNLKDMIHSIHAAEMRTNPYKHTRSKSGSNTIYDWSGAVYPQKINNCEACHKPGTYGAVPAGALPTVDVTPTNGVSIFDARNKLPNTTDIVISPYSAACVSCHDSSPAKAHMTANGGVISKARTAFTAGTEQCAICHGEGRSAAAH